MSGTILVEVVFADKNSQRLIEVTLPIDSTVASAIEASGLQAEFPNYKLGELSVGVWGRIVTLDQTVRCGDRIEIYR
ncbi:MAG: RnfH family protein, partial [Woeseiaceae bacterium]